MYEIEELIDAIGVPILVFDRSLTLKYYNDAAKTLIPNVKKNLAAESIFNDKKISSQIVSSGGELKNFITQSTPDHTRHIVCLIRGH